MGTDVVTLPIKASFPGRIAPGRVSDQFVTSLEIVPTLLQLTGARAPEGVRLDGFDILPLLTGRDASPRSEMFWQRKDDKAARVGHWKWVESQRGNGLFDLSDDVGETNDLSEEFPDKLKELKDAFSQWKAEMAAAEPRGPFRDY